MAFYRSAMRWHGADVAAMNDLATESSNSRQCWRTAALLAVLITIMFVIRVPALWKQPGGMDEELFAIPGWTVWTEGVPRIPYMPERAPTGFQESDRLVFALPPLSFYWQAIFFGAFGCGYPAARLASLAAGAAAIVLTYGIGRRVGLRREACLAAAALYSISRAVHFPATIARPDMLCTALELGAVYSFLAWREKPTAWRLTLTGVLLGLAGLTHPTAIVPAIQVAVWCILVEATVAVRLRRLALVTASAILTASCWWWLIRLDPELFHEQFFANVLGRTTTGMADRLLAPWASAWAQLAPMIGRLNPIQFSFAILGTLAPLLWGWRGTGRTLCLLSASAAGLLILLMTKSHPAHGYWSYPAAFWLSGLCFVADAAASRRGWRRPARWSMYAVFLAASLPGAGLRTAATAWLRDDCVSSRNCFVATLLQRLPPDARLLVDPAFAFDIYCAGRPTTLAVFEPEIQAARPIGYDYLIVSRYGLANQHPSRFNGKLFFTRGDPEDLFGCFAQVYVPAENARVAVDLPTSAPLWTSMEQVPSDAATTP
jgi:hypothetical protein